ncbi:condensin subunit Smc [Synechococcus sp. PCC 7502]|uniref:chromosome segregation protein SMC n=1 Tax=Synechococcus sp. PCC 7502 TaxID=1173263 RepID=UPI00029F974F|nr:chromosome segregation protein SMC [Synechococcus sp. PCC 7502]AFY73121.1 condensin subunit Smc [Synechococcus sp. PCC 7502]
MYIKHIELSRFKSFGNTTPIPMLPGFTVVSGPNGSGKSNILDALLFALGLSGSKGMRAERLPDLVNQEHSKKGKTVEASATVTFALDQPVNGLDEWIVSRRLRVTGQGTYTSTYYINGSPCTLTELHEQLASLRIYPEGYNVVLQGDVTSIISMNSRDRRAIIDELAGVGEFDRKIITAKEKLDDVKSQEDKFRIVEQELILAQEKLKSDRLKAQKYQALRQELATLESSEVVLHHRQLQQQQKQKLKQQANIRVTIKELDQELAELAQTIATSNLELEALNLKVKSLGEDEHLALTSEIATKNAELRALQRTQQESSNRDRTNQEQIGRIQTEISQYLQETEQLSRQRQAKEQEILDITQVRNRQLEIVTGYRTQLQAIASASTDWVKQQAQLQTEINNLLAQLDPQRQELTRLQERSQQWQLQIEALTNELNHLELNESSCDLDLTNIQALAQSHAIALSEALAETQTLKTTQERLINEQRLKSRQLDKLEAQTQATREIQGTRASQVIMEANLRGVHGLVAELGWVQPQYQSALGIAAGNRMTFLVVDDDGVAADAINLLKTQRAGRATFLPLNKLKRAGALPRFDPRCGAIDYALNLIEFDHEYLDVFAFIFGQTLIYERLDQARPHIGRYRMVTLDGDLLETTGAMTGGSSSNHTGMQFGNYAQKEPRESSEVIELSTRLEEIDRILQSLNQKLSSLQITAKTAETELQASKLQVQQLQQQSDRHTKQIQRQQQIQTQIQQQQTALNLSHGQMETLVTNITALESRLAIVRTNLANLESSSTHTDWQNSQTLVQTAEQELNHHELNLSAATQELERIQNQGHLNQEKINQRQSRLQELRSEQMGLLNAIAQSQTQAKGMESQILELQTKLNVVDQTLGAVKQERDQSDRNLRNHQAMQQQLQWQLQKQQEEQIEVTSQLLQIAQDIEKIELPNPISELPSDMTLEQLQMEVRRLQKRITAMEPVNMMAIAEYEATTNRLTELSERLETLSQERTELLLRIENFTTLRQRSFMQAFDAVNEHFKTIFAELSDGDGHLQLENPSAPLSGGLTLVAHPKGKQVTHLASMSGGEKSLTALSFIFALQRYRPSPFYAFDEVDMFLDGANVERLSAMVRKQAESAQFIVVSLRRPMIEAADRTIGVTQARGAHTQVLGLQLRSG